MAGAQTSLARITSRRRVLAPLRVVFRVVSDIRTFARAVPAIVRIEFLGDVELGMGTRVRETRRVLGLEMTADFEVTEYVEDERIRAVTVIRSTRWDTSFAVTMAAEWTDLSMTMIATPITLRSRT